LNMSPVLVIFRVFVFFFQRKQPDIQFRMRGI